MDRCGNYHLEWYELRVVKGRRQNCSVQNDPKTVTDCFQDRLVALHKRFLLYSTIA